MNNQQSVKLIHWTEMTKRLQIPGYPIGYFSKGFSKDPSSEGTVIRNPTTCWGQKIQEEVLQYLEETSWPPGKAIKQQIKTIREQLSTKMSSP